MFSAGQWFWYVMGEYCRYWEWQCRLPEALRDRGMLLPPARTSEQSLPEHLRLIVDNTRC